MNPEHGNPRRDAINRFQEQFGSEFMQAGDDIAQLESLRDSIGNNFSQPSYDRAYTHVDQERRNNNGRIPDSLLQDPRTKEAIDPIIRALRMANFVGMALTPQGFELNCGPKEKDLLRTLTLNQPPITLETALALRTIVSKAFTRKDYLSTDPNLSELRGDLIHLDGNTANRVMTALRETMGPALPPDMELAPPGQERNFDYDWKTIFSDYLNDRDKDLVEALYSAEGLKKYILEMAQTYNNDMNQISEELRSRIFFTFSKIMSPIDNGDPRKDVHRIMQEQQTGMRGGMGGALSRVIQLLSLLSEDPEIHNLNLQLSRNVFAEEAENRDLNIRQVDGTIKQTTLRKFEFTPEKRNESLPQWLKAMSFELDTERNLKFILHNTKAAATNYDNEQGFWSHFAGQIGNLETKDIMRIRNFPDGDKIEVAVQLFQKLLEEEMAKRDWRTHGDLFQVNSDTNRTNIANNVLRALRIMYANIDTDEQRKEARINAILRWAEGIAYSLDLIPHLTCAAADGVREINRDGKPLYQSPPLPGLDAFDPNTLADQWDAPHLVQLGLFTLNDPHDRRRITPHMALELRDAYIKSFSQGLKPIEDFCKRHQLKTDPKHIYESLPINAFHNLFDVGNPFKQGGWRLRDAVIDGVRYEEIQGAHEMNFIKTWQALEHGGLPLLRDFIKNANNIPGYDSLMKDSSHRDEFFQFIFDKYYARSAAGSYESVLQATRQKAEQTIDEKIKRGIIRKKDRDQEVEKEYVQSYLYGAMGRWLIQASPTKAMRLERTRYTEDGVRAWKKYREKLYTLPEGHYIISKGSEHISDSFDEVVQDLLLAESISVQDAHAVAFKHNQDGKDLADLTDVDYTLNRAKLQQILQTRVYIDPHNQQEQQQRMNAVLKLYDMLEQDYVHNQEAIDSLTEQILSSPMDITRELTFADMIRFGDYNVYKRTIGDIKNAEKYSQLYVDLVGKMVELSYAGKKSRNMNDYVSILSQMQKGLQADASLEYSLEVTERLVQMIIDFHDEGTWDWNLVTDRYKPGATSLSTAHSPRSGWNWQAKEISEFIDALYTAEVFIGPYQPMNMILEYLNEEDDNKDIEVTIPLINKEVTIRAGIIKDIFTYITTEGGVSKNLRTSFGEMSPSRLRQKFGAEIKALNIPWLKLETAPLHKVVNTAPIVLVAVVLLLAYDAMKEEVVDKQQ